MAPSGGSHSPLRITRSAHRVRVRPPRRRHRRVVLLVLVQRRRAADRLEAVVEQAAVERVAPRRPAVPEVLVRRLVRREEVRVEPRQRADEDQRQYRVQDHHQERPLAEDRLADVVPVRERDDPQYADDEEVDAGEGGTVDEGEVRLVVAAADAGADPGAVVVELLDAGVADGAVGAARRAVEAAGRAVLGGDLVAVHLPRPSAPAAADRVLQSHTLLPLNMLCSLGRMEGVVGAEGHIGLPVECFRTVCKSYVQESGSTMSPETKKEKKPIRPKMP